MPVSFHCASCGTKITAPDKAAGKKSSCPKCGNQIVIPGERQHKTAEAVQTPLASPPTQQPMVVYEPPVQQIAVKGSSTKDCLACGEMVLKRAKVCKFCGLDPDIDPDDEPRRRRKQDDDSDDERRSVNVVVRNETNVRVGGKKFPHVLHFVLTVITCGLWFPVWVLAYLFSSK